jgi:hypothetical protein
MVFLLGWVVVGDGELCNVMGGDVRKSVVVLLVGADDVAVCCLLLWMFHPRARVMLLMTFDLSKLLCPKWF